MSDSRYDLEGMLHEDIIEKPARIERDLAAAQARIAELERERDALRADAERYRWLRDCCEGWQFTRLMNDSGPLRTDVDAAIDKAREGK